MKRKLIGIPGFKNSEDMFGVTGNYMEFADHFGDVRIIMPHEEHVKVDLLILPGGLDMNPKAYGKIPGFKTSNQDVFKEFFYTERLDNYIGNTAIFGICLGFQMLNVKFGGALVQNIKGHPTSSHRWTKAHEVYSFQKDDKGERIKWDVNSHHHQAVSMKTMSKEFDWLTYSDETRHDGKIVESFIHKTLPIAGVQWHPEEWYDAHSEGLINHLFSLTEKVVEEPVIQ